MQARWSPSFRFTEFQLLVAPGLLTIVGLLTIFLAPRRSLDWSWSDIWVSLAYVGIVAGISLTFGLRGFRGDQTLLPLTATLAALGLLMVQRLMPDLARRDPGYAGLAAKQLIYLGLGLAILWGTVVVVRPLPWLRRYKYTWLLLTLALLGVTMVFGTEINGARLWLQIGPFQAQPSEIVKITLVVFMAGYLEDKRDLLGSSWKIGFLRLPPVPYLLPMGLMWAASLMVLVVQNDLGSALLFFGIFLTMLYVASGRIVYVSVGLLSFAFACWGAYRRFDRIGIRVQNWLDPWQDPLASGYQQVQSDYALASGGLLGTGLGMGRPAAIPEVQTDFVFSAIGEELGLLGALAVLALYFLLVMRGFAIALRARDGFARLVAVGLTTILGLQTIIIVGGVIRLIPLTGITLPFVSYGGSSLLTNFLIVGLLLNISGQGARHRVAKRGIVHER
ncbi:MAG: FtsW-like cell division membrane protein CA_C0505 [uncultured Thermomicrobiales bacterium]|uniref:FtsW-like cell division membrane protein CA_C0505 n=1 Tax=uncultured Thermomicrobiales bacterium TaxID=1645740 RepID=A0A6J4UBT5_9BACT|nr:MAG: FtsW-like cell division membrane protein CA_C0505 [uncultured Thermomicrobiales bacterium]